MNTSAVRSDWVGRVIDGRFTLLKWLGGSGSGGVFLTELQGDGSQKAAIKLIPADAENAEARIAGWAATKPLSHPHLMRLFQIGRCQIDNAGFLYSVTEFAEELLSQIIPERPLTPREVREMLDPVLDVLSYLHGKGVVHGRVRPSNIMVVGAELKLSSDSIYAPGDGGKRPSSAGVYDPPEGAKGKLSPAADIWSLGVTLVEALTQHPPLLDRPKNGAPGVPESIPQPFADIARECLRPDPLRRCTLSAVGARLEPGLAPPDKAGTDKSVPSKLPAKAIIAALLVLFAIIGALLVRSHHQTQSSVATEERRAASPTATLPSQSPVPERQRSNGVVVKGTVAERTLPDVPRSASATIRGKVEVKIRVAVDPSGNVSNATFASAGASRYFANLAMQAAQHWSFKPPQVDGEAVSSVWILKFEFKPAATEVTPVEASP